MKWARWPSDIFLKNCMENFRDLYGIKPFAKIKEKLLGDVRFYSKTPKLYCWDEKVRDGTFCYKTALDMLEVRGFKKLMWVQANYFFKSFT